MTNNATKTRAITDILRRFTSGHAGYWHKHGLLFGVVLDRRYGRRRYAVDISSSTRAAWPISIDVSERSYYIRPLARPNYDNGPDVIYDKLRQDAAETRLYDALFDTLDAAGYTPEAHSETRASLAQWRAARTPADHYA